jgi:hypothetical protein
MDKDWDLYMFLNSTKEGELKERLPEVKTRVLPPPTDLDAFLKVDVDYGNGLRLIRHNSQRDAKHPEYTNDLISQIWMKLMKIHSSFTCQHIARHLIILMFINLK